jgi:hypothetical protein
VPVHAACAAWTLGRYAAAAMHWLSLSDLGCPDLRQLLLPRGHAAAVMCPAALLPCRRVSGMLAQSIHDFAVTPDYYVLYQSPVMFNLHKFATEFLTGAVSLAECVEQVGS